MARSASNSKLKLFQSYPVYVVPAGHVGEDHFVPWLQTGENLHRIHRALPQLHRYAGRSLAVRIKLEHAYRAVFLPESGAADVLDIVQAIEIDGAIHAQIWTRTRRQLPGELHVHRHRAVDNCWINAFHRPVNHSIVSID